MSNDTTLYVVVDEGPDEVPRDQVVTFYTNPHEAEDTATDPDRVPVGTVYKLVEVGRPTDPRDRLNGLIQAVAFHAEVGVDEHEHVVRTAAEMAAFLTDGTVPAASEEEPRPEFVDPFAALARLGQRLAGKHKVEIRRPHDEALEVVVNGEVVAEANHDEHGWSGMDAVEKTALAVARALGVDLGDVEPGEAGGST